MVNRRISEQFTGDLLAAVDEYVSAERLSVFVMGPDVSNDTPSARLRREIIYLCNGENLAVKAEHSEMISEVKKKLRKGFTLVALELFMARRSDSVVIIPDSAGSLAELGLFATLPNICKKMIILFDKRHARTQKSYIARGPRKQAKDTGAEIRFVDYGDPTKAWRHIMARIETTRATKIMQRMHLQG